MKAFILILVVSFFVRCPVALTEPHQKVFEIVMIIPLSGPSAAWGEHTRNGAQLAYASLSSANRARLNVRFEDDQLDGTKAVSAFRHHARAGLNCVVLFGSQSGSSVLPLLEKEGILSFVITAKREIVDGTKFAFRHWIDSETQSQLLVEALQNQGINRVALFVATHEATLDMAHQFTRLAGSAGISVVSRTEYPPQERDFRIPLTRMKAQDLAQSIVLPLLPGQLSAFIKQLKELGVGLPVFGFSTAENSSEVQASGEAIEGMFYIGPSYNTSFVRRYEKRYGKYPEVAAGNSYDIILMLASALERGFGSTEEIAAYLRNLTQFNGAMGPYSAGPRSDFILPAALKVIRNGKFTVYKNEATLN